MIVLEDQVITPTIFPDKTSQIWQIDEKLLRQVSILGARITWHFESEAELIQVAQLKNLLSNYTESISLHIPYLPYGRQDKKVSNDSTFALTTFCKILDNIGFTQITTLDAHSDVSKCTIRNIEPTVFIEDTIKMCSPDIICFPDQGAHSRYIGMVSGPVIITNKVRNQKTGYIENIKLYMIGMQPKNADILIVDDICDGGMTFKLVAKQLLTEGAKSVNLYVTHGIFSKGIETLKESGISRIFTYEGEIL